MPPESNYGNLTIPSYISSDIHIPSDILEFYRSFNYRYFAGTVEATSNYCFNFIDYPTTFRFETPKRKIKTLDIE